MMLYFSLLFVPHGHIQGRMPGLSSSVIDSVIDRLAKDEVYSVSDYNSFTNASSS